LLEAEILDAAWEELRQRGWSGFRIEGVAARSGTGKAAIYARWRNRHDLVRAAVTHSQRHTAGTWTSQGDLRTDLVTYLTSVAAFVSGPDGEALRALVSATPSDGQAVGASWQERIEVPSLIVEAAQRRGDLELGTVDPLVLRLGQMVVGQIWLMSGQLQSGIAEHVVDAIWLPALRVAAGAGTGS
jgi:AcrR family transcriptional regulator